MTENPTTTQAPELPFRAILTPHRSLSARGFIIFMTVLAAVSFAMGVAFMAVGAWPVMGFLGLDVAIIYLAFRVNYRSGRLYEIVEVDHDALALTRVHPSGREERYRLETYWTRVQIDEAVDGRTEISIGNRGRFITFGRFLTDEERKDFAGVLRDTLRAAREKPGV